MIDPTTGAIIDGPVTTVVPASAGFSYIQHLGWSKSSLTNHIAFVLYSNSYPNGVIYSVDASGASSPQLVPSTANGGGPDQPTWSPDDPTTPSVDETDKFLLYEEQVPTGKRSSGMEIVRQELATGTVTTVVPPSSGSWLGWTDWRRAPTAFVSSWGTASSVTASTATVTAAATGSTNTLVALPASPSDDTWFPSTNIGLAPASGGTRTATPPDGNQSSSAAAVTTQDQVPQSPHGPSLATSSTDLLDAFFADFAGSLLG